MAKKKFFWQRKKKYYQFPWWMRLAKGIGTVAWTVFQVGLGAALVALALILVAGCVFAFILGNYLQDDVIPNSDFNVEQFSLEQSSFIYYLDENNQIREQQQINTTIDRVWVPYEEIPEDLIHAAVAIEDKRFFQHQGVDWFTTTKACVNMFLGSRSTFGGSTITQQLIKNLTQEDDVTVRRKVQEIFRALQFEEKYDKEDVMEWYLNTIYLGENCYGVRTAAQTYFGKDVTDLTAAECASLISITNNPSLYDPFISLERNRARQLTVLSEMHTQGYLTDAEYQAAVDEKLVFGKEYNAEQYTCANESCGFSGSRDAFNLLEQDPGGYQCPSCGNPVEIPPEEEEDFYTYFDDTVIRDVIYDLMDKTGYTYKVCDQMVKTGGYHIYTTLDPNVQELVDQVYEDLDRIPTTDSNQQLQSAIVVIENATGDIVAMSGGVGKKDTYLGWNRATQSMLQPGSAIKPISVYGPALELGLINPATVLFDGPLYDQYPQNYDRVYSGYTTILDGVSQSMNTIACRVVNMIGTDYSYDYAKNKFGISTLIDHEVINGSEKSDIALAPMAMGAMTYGVTVRNITAAYATYTNNGTWREARTYTKVLDSEGNVVLDNTQDSRQILSKKTVDYMNYMLYYAVNYGTASPARISGMSVAGKTGTTSDDNDRWFAGYTPYYTAVVWCGFDQPETIRLTGTTTNPSARLWHAVMEPLHAGLEDQSLYDSSAMSTYYICTESGKIATDACRADPRKYSCVMATALYPEDAPDGYCDLHVATPYCEAGKAAANEYCALVPGNTVTTKSMVKMTEEMVEMYESANIDISGFGYLSKGGGKEENKTVCTLHTKESVAPPTTPVAPTAPTTPPNGG